MMIQKVLSQMKDMYIFLSIIGECITKNEQKKRLTTSDKIDRIVTNRWLALPIFAVSYVDCILCICNNSRCHFNRLDK